MKVLQKIVRFVSILIGILFKHYRLSKKWCDQCKFSNYPPIDNDYSPCTKCVASVKMCGLCDKPSNFSHSEN